MGTPELQVAGDEIKMPRKASNDLAFSVNSDKMSDQDQKAPETKEGEEELDDW